MNKYTIGIDVGGTNIKMGLLDLKGNIVHRRNLETKSFIRNKEKLITAIVLAIEELIKTNGLNRKNIMGVGFGLPGLIDSQIGIVHLLPNIPKWKNVPLKKIIENKIKIPVFIDNDVNVITLGEWKFGAGKDYKNLICLTLGTGVGAGLILDNNLYRGEGFAAGELGHMPLNEKGPVCNCGGIGCLERYIGNTYLQEKAAKIFKKKNIKLEEVFYLANQGNIRALEFWQETATHIGNGLVGPVNLLNPRAIIIGGGVSNSFMYLKKTIGEIIKKRSMKVQGNMVRVLKAKLGNDAGLLGSQVLIRSYENI